MRVYGECMFDFKKERAIREARHMSRAYVEQETGINASALFRLEHGNRGTNNLDCLNALAILYGCYLDDFLKDGYQLQ